MTKARKRLTREALDKIIQFWIIHLQTFDDGHDPKDVDYALTILNDRIVGRLTTRKWGSNVCDTRNT